MAAVSHFVEAYFIFMNTLLVVKANKFQFFPQNVLVEISTFQEEYYVRSKLCFHAQKMLFTLNVIMTFLCQAVNALK